MTKPGLLNNLVLSLSVVLICYLNQAFPQAIYPPTVSIPVTYYDFHSDKSNPEFEQPHMAGVHTGMVAEALDINKKPLLGPSPYLDYGIAKWFRPWQGGDFTAPSYQKISGGEFDAVIAYNGMQVKNYDTSYKNITINDTLSFTYMPGSSGTYEFSSQNFYPLDGKGFGQEGQTHNCSFTMECHTMFSYLTNQVFTYEGFDDIWVFVNGKLVLDMGGIHSSRSGQVIIDSVPGLVRPQTYPLDIFWTQRHSPDSKIRITANIVIPVEPVRLFLNLMPPCPDTLMAGDSLNLFARIIDDTGGLHPEYDSSIYWSLYPAGTTSRLRTTLGGTNTFYAVQAYSTCIIAANYNVSPINILRVFDTVYVKPGPAYRYFIEPYTAAISPVPNPVDSIVLSDVIPSMDIYAVRRDKYGSFAGFDSTVTWEELGDSGIVKLMVPVQPYICRVEKVRQGIPHILCTKWRSTFDTLKVIVKRGTNVVSRETVPGMKQPKVTKEYFNLRGQKLEPGRINRTNGIIFERIIASDGSICIRKINSQSAIRYKLTGDIE